MDIGDVLIWEATNGLLLIPVVIGLVMLARRVRGKPVFTEHDWLFLFGYSRKEVFSPRLLLRSGPAVHATSEANKTSIAPDDSFCFILDSPFGSLQSSQ